MKHKLFIIVFLFSLFAFMPQLMAGTTTVAANHSRLQNGGLLIYHSATIGAGNYVVSDHFDLDRFNYADSIKGAYAVLISGTNDTIVTIIEGTFNQTNHVTLDSVITYANGGTQTLQKGAIDLTGIKYPYYRIKHYAYNAGTIKEWLYFLKP